MAIIKNKPIRFGTDAGGFSPDTGVSNGIERLISGFLSGLRRNIFKTDALYVYRFGSPLSKRPVKWPKFRTLPSRFFASFFLPLHLLLDRIHVYLGFSGVLPPLVRILKMKSIIFIHDFGFLDRPQNYGNPGKMRWETEYSVYGADKIIVFSDYIKEQLKSRFPGIPESKIIRIYPGADHLKKNKTVFTDKENPFFLYVGVIKPAKNILSLLNRFEIYLRTYRHKKDRLMLLGSREDRYFESILKSDVYRRIGMNVDFIENAGDRELATLYQKCTGLLNVSHEEGFCYPVVEALTMGTPVIVNDIPLYRELRRFGGDLTITQTDKKFVGAMQRARAFKAQKKTPADTQFTWHTFSKKVMEVAESI